MDAERRSNDCPRCRELERRVAELETLVRSLSDQVAKLSAALEEERRRGKRQAAPFSQGADPSTEPKKPGRKSGQRHGPHAHRSVPPRIDETYDVPLPQTCPHCGESARERNARRRAVSDRDSADGDLSPLRRACRHVRTTAAARSQADTILQTSTARGAAASQLGPAGACLAGDSQQRVGPVARQERRSCCGRCSPSCTSPEPPASVRRCARPSVVLRPTNNSRIDLRGASEVAPDETGWRVGGRSAWLHAFVSQQ